MSESVTRVRVLHVWDYRVDSGTNIDDHLSQLDLEQLSLSRVLTQKGKITPLRQNSLHAINTIISPYPANKLLRQISKMRYVKLLKSEIRAFKPAVIYFHFGQTAASLMPTLAKFNIPFVVAFYGHDISVALHQRRWQEKYKNFSQFDARYLVLSQGVRRRVVALGIDPDQITEYNYPLQLRAYLNVQKSCNAGNFVLTIPGRLVEKKGHIILFQAIHILNGRGIALKLNVLGYGSEWARFKEAAVAAGIAEQVEWIDTAEATIEGEFDELYTSVLERTDLVVLPCITSSSGDDEAGPALVLCLAQASGTPVLTTAFEGHEVSISDGKTGVLAIEGDANDLAEKIAWCLRNPEPLAEIARAGRNCAQEAFNQERNLRLIYDVIASQAQKSSSKAKK